MRPGPRGLPGRPRRGCACGQGSFAIGTGVHQQVAGHQVAFHPNVDGQFGQAPVDPVDHLHQRFRGERVLDHDVVVGGIGHHLCGEARVPAGVAQRRQMIGQWTHQDTPPSSACRRPPRTARSARPSLPAAFDGLPVLLLDGPDQIGFGAEVITDRGIVPLSGSLADLAIGDGEDPMLGEQPLGGGQDRLLGGAGPLAARGPRGGHPVSQRFHLD